MGDKDFEIVKQCYRMKKPVPARIKGCPELLSWLFPIYEGFFELVTCTTSEGRIPWDSIFNYATANRLAENPSEIRRVVELIRAMERVYKEDQQEKLNRKNRTAKRKGRALGNGDP